MTEPVELDVDRMTERERAGWLAFSRAMFRYVDRGDATYAAVPHALLRSMGLPAYPLDAFALFPHLCGLDGFLRDDRAEVDWLCLLPYGHGRRVVDDLTVVVEPAELRHGWDRIYGAGASAYHPRLTILDATITGLRPELDDAGDELVWHVEELMGDLGGHAGTINDLRRLS